MGRTLKRKITDFITFNYWKLSHPKSITRFGIKFKIDPWVVPYYITNKKSFLKLLPLFDFFVNEDSTVIDIGASFGFYSLYSSLIRKANAVIAFEPTSRAYTLLIDNIKNSNTNNINCYRCAVGDVNKKIKINYCSVGSGYSSIVEKSLNYDWVDMIRVDDVVSKADFVKIDVEGAEYYVLQGMKKILSNSQPAIVLELSHYEQEIKELLQSYGYQIVLSIGHNALALHEKDNFLLPELLSSIKEFEKVNKLKLSLKNLIGSQDK